MNNIMIIIIIILIALLLVYLYITSIEPFGEYLSIVDPYSIPLWQDASRREDLWNHKNTWKLNYYRDLVPKTCKE